MTSKYTNASMGKQGPFSPFHSSCFPLLSACSSPGHSVIARRPLVQLNIHASKNVDQFIFLGKLLREQISE